MAINVAVYANLVLSFADLLKKLRNFGLRMIMNYN